MFDFGFSYLFTKEGRDWSRLMRSITASALLSRFINASRCRFESAWAHVAPQSYFVCGRQVDGVLHTANLSSSLNETLGEVFTRPKRKARCNLSDALVPQHTQALPQHHLLGSNFSLRVGVGSQRASYSPADSWRLLRGDSRLSGALCAHLAQDLACFDLTGTASRFCSAESSGAAV